MPFSFFYITDEFQHKLRWACRWFKPKILLCEGCVNTIKTIHMPSFINLSFWKRWFMIIINHQTFLFCTKDLASVKCDSPHLSYCLLLTTIVYMLKSSLLLGFLQECCLVNEQLNFFWSSNGNIHHMATCDQPCLIWLLGWCSCLCSWIYWLWLWWASDMWNFQYRGGNFFSC